ncbi:MAG: STAS domain-containing protein [Magnetococcales bacterium]|nr:STAS domain-containing protein [Magnetococcales bacterium]
MDFKIKYSDNNREMTVKVPKKCTYQTWKESKQSWMTNDYSKIEKCTIDFSRTTYIDSSGIGALLTLKELLTDGAQIIFVNMNDGVRNVLDITNLSKIVTVI